MECGNLMRKDDMQNRYLYLVKNTGILAISNFSSKILAFLLVPLYTRVLTTEEYGSYDLISTTIQLLIPIFTVNICEAVVRYLMDKNIKENDVITIGAKYCCIGLILFIVVAICNRITNLVPMLNNYVIMMIALFFSTVLYQYTSSIAKGLEKVTCIAVAGIISTVVMILGNIVLLLYFKLGIIGFFLSSILSQLIPAVILFSKMNVWGRINRDSAKHVQISMTKYSAPLILNSVGWWMNNALDRYAVTFICGAAVNGIFSVAYKIPTILATVQQIFIQAWQISAIKEYSNDSKHFYGEMMNFINMTMGITCMSLIVTTKLLARFLYANEFYQAWKYVPFLLVSGVMNSVSGVLGPILCADKNSKTLGKSTFYGAGVNVVLNITLVYSIGPQGAAIATLISSFAIYLLRDRALIGKIDQSNKNKMLVSWILLTIQASIMIYCESYSLQVIVIIIYLSLYCRELKKICYIAGSCLNKYLHSCK